MSSGLSQNNYGAVIAPILRSLPKSHRTPPATEQETRQTLAGLGENIELLSLARFALIESWTFWIEVVLSRNPHLAEFEGVFAFTSQQNGKQFVIDLGLHLFRQSAEEFHLLLVENPVLPE